MKKTYNKFNLISLLVVILLVLSLPLFLSYNSEEVTFQDPGLEKAIRITIKKEEGPIFINEVDTLEVLNAQGYKIKDLSGIENLFNLRELNLEDNFVQDVSPLKNNMRLRILNLRNNEITSLAEIKFDSLIHLHIRDLNLRHNVVRDKEGNDSRIKDISILGKMISLRKLDLRDNQIEDLTPLSNLRRLTSLDLRENKFTDIEALSVLSRLEELNLRENDISSLEPIKYLHRLTYLNIHSLENLKSLDPLKELHNLETLIMENVKVDTNDFLVGKTKLQKLNATETNLELFDKKVIEDILNVGGLTGEVRPYRLINTLDTPMIDKESGFYKEGFSLTIEAVGNTYYTLDGSEPTIKSELYKEPISIIERDSNSAYVIRFKTIESSLSSETVSKTYFVSENIDERFTLPIFSIITDSDNLFDEKIGIYHENNYAKKGKEWERLVQIEYFDNEGTLRLSQGAGLRIHGGATRQNAQKSLRLYARLEYDKKDSFDYDFFGGLKKNDNSGLVKSFKRINLRAGGDSWNRTMFDDAFMQSLVSHLNTFDKQAYKPAVVFINGEYYGIQNIREKYDRYYYNSHYGINEEDVVVLKRKDLLSEGGIKDVYEYRKLLKEIESKSFVNDYDFEWLQTKIDIESFLDYFASEIYFGNADWPHNNIRFWRKRVSIFDENAPYGHDGRWRWSMYDTDAGFYFADRTIGHKEYYWDYRHNTIDWVMDELDGRTGKNTWANFLFRSVMQNEHFYNNFLNKMNDLINSAFLETRVNEVLDNFKDGISTEMLYQIERWGAIDSMETWNNNINKKRIFAKERPFYIRKYMMEEFDLKGLIHIEVSNETKQGYIKLNSLKINS